MTKSFWECAQYLGERRRGDEFRRSSKEQQHFYAH